jgi:hypothetical protein
MDVLDKHLSTLLDILGNDHQTKRVHMVSDKVDSQPFETELTLGMAHDQWVSYIVYN